MPKDTSGDRREDFKASLAKLTKFAAFAWLATNGGGSIGVRGEENALGRRTKAKSANIPSHAPQLYEPFDDDDQQLAGSKQKFNSLETLGSETSDTQTHESDFPEVDNFIRKNDLSATKDHLRELLVLIQGGTKQNMAMLYLAQQASNNEDLQDKLKDLIVKFNNEPLADKMKTSESNVNIYDQLSRLVAFSRLFLEGTPAKLKQTGKSIIFKQISQAQPFADLLRQLPIDFIFEAIVQFHQSLLSTPPTSAAAIFNELFSLPSYSLNKGNQQISTLSALIEYLNDNPNLLDEQNWQDIIKRALFLGNTLYSSQPNAPDLYNQTQNVAKLKNYFRQLKKRQDVLYGKIISGDDLSKYTTDKLVFLASTAFQEQGWWYSTNNYIHLAIKVNNLKALKAMASVGVLFLSKIINNLYIQKGAAEIAKESYWTKEDITKFCEETEASQLDKVGFKYSYSEYVLLSKLVDSLMIHNQADTQQWYNQLVNLHASPKLGLSNIQQMKRMWDLLNDETLYGLSAINIDDKNILAGMLNNQYNMMGLKKNSRNIINTEWFLNPIAAVTLLLILFISIFFKNILSFLEKLPSLLYKSEDKSNQQLLKARTFLSEEYNFLDESSLLEEADENSQRELCYKFPIEKLSAGKFLPVPHLLLRTPSFVSLISDRAIFYQDSILQLKLICKQEQVLMSDIPASDHLDHAKITQNIKRQLAEELVTRSILKNIIQKIFRIDEESIQIISNPIKDLYISIDVLLKSDLADKKLPDNIMRFILDEVFKTQDFLKPNYSPKLGRFYVFPLYYFMTGLANNWRASSRIYGQDMCDFSNNGIFTQKDISTKIKKAIEGHERYKEYFAKIESEKADARKNELLQKAKFSAKTQHETFKTKYEKDLESKLSDYGKLVENLRTRKEEILKRQNFLTLCRSRDVAMRAVQRIENTNTKLISTLQGYIEKVYTKHKNHSYEKSIKHPLVQSILRFRGTEAPQDIVGYFINNAQQSVALSVGEISENINNCTSIPDVESKIDSISQEFRDAHKIMENHLNELIDCIKLFIGLDHELGLAISQLSSHLPKHITRAGKRLRATNEPQRSAASAREIEQRIAIPVGQPAGNNDVIDVMVLTEEDEPAGPAEQISSSDKNSSNATDDESFSDDQCQSGSSNAGVNETAATGTDYSTNWDFYTTDQAGSAFRTKKAIAIDSDATVGQLKTFGDLLIPLFTEHGKIDQQGGPTRLAWHSAATFAMLHLTRMLGWKSNTKFRHSLDVVLDDWCNDKTKTDEAYDFFEKVTQGGNALSLDYLTKNFRAENFPIYSDYAGKSDFLDDSRFKSLFDESIVEILRTRKQKHLENLKLLIGPRFDMKDLKALKAIDVSAISLQAMLLSDCWAIALKYLISSDQSTKFHSLKDAESYVKQKMGHTKVGAYWQDVERRAAKLLDIDAGKIRNFKLLRSAAASLAHPTKQEDQKDCIQLSHNLKKSLRQLLDPSKHSSNQVNEQTLFGHGETASPATLENPGESANAGLVKIENRGPI
jgi:hypothetical protein